MPYQGNRISESTLISRRYNELTALIILLSVLITLVGLISLYSVSSYSDIPFYAKSFFKQIIWFTLGLALAIILFFFQKNIIYSSAYIIYSIGMILLVIPFLTPSQIASTNRWIGLGFIQLQPSEFIKLALILAVAKYLSSPKTQKSRFTTLFIPLFLAFLPAAIVFKQPDFGTAMVYLAVVFPMLFWAEVRLFYLFILIAPFISIVTAFNFYSFFIWVILLLIVIYFTNENLVLSIIIFVGNIFLGLLTPLLWNRLHSYQQNRILTLFNLEADPQGAGYQVIQSQTAIGSGGLLGKGLGHGTQTHLKFLPEQHTDFIFSVVGEEMGFIMVAIVLFMFFSLIITMIYLAYKSKDQYSALVIIGVASMLLFHIVVNIGMTVGIMPVTGLPLPFMSYGGSFMLSCYIAIGLVLNSLTEQY